MVGSMIDQTEDSEVDGLEGCITLLRSALLTSRLALRMFVQQEGGAQRFGEAAIQIATAALDITPPGEDEVS